MSALLLMADAPTPDDLPPRPAQRPGRVLFPGFGRWLAIGSQLVGSSVVGVLGGLWIDGRAGTSPVWTAILGIAGVAVGLYLVVREGMRG